MGGTLAVTPGSCAAAILAIVATGIVHVSRYGHAEWGYPTYSTSGYGA